MCLSVSVFCLGTRHKVCPERNMNQSDQCHLQFPSDSLLVLSSRHHHVSKCTDFMHVCLPIRRILCIYTQQNSQDLLFRQIAQDVGVRLLSWGDLRNRLRMKKGVGFFFLVFFVALPPEMCTHRSKLWQTDEGEHVDWSKQGREG